jgi:hypothetical protein
MLKKQCKETRKKKKKKRRRKKGKRSSNKYQNDFKIKKNKYI